MTAFLILLMTLGGTGDAPAWRHVVPPPGDPAEHPPFRALGLSADRPDDVVERVEYRGHRRRYAQVRFGSPSSVRVTVVIDQVGPGRADLYVDAGRNRRIEPRDRVEPGADGRTWRLPLDAAFVEGETTTLDRRAAVFRLGSTGTTLSMAAAGYFEGTVRVGGRTCLARRVDGDGDGLLTDPRDRLGIDLDGDGRIDPADEVFPLAPVLNVRGDRLAVRADPRGRWLVLEPLTGSGVVRVDWPRPEGSPRVLALSTTLYGRDGSAVALEGPGAEATVPPGAYRLGAVSMTLEDPAGGPSWSYVFADADRRGEPRWLDVADGQTVALDPIGTPELTTGREDSVEPTAPGGAVTTRPGLFVGDGLRIVTCYRGAPASPAGGGEHARVTLEADDGRALVQAYSGFA